MKVQVLPSPLIPRTRSSAESERDPAKVEAARSNRAGFTTVFYGVAKLERHESLKLARVGSNPISVAQAEVAQLGGGASLRNWTVGVRNPPSAPKLLKLSWRNWQTRTVESRVVEGSSPSDSTIHLLA